MGGSVSALDANWEPWHPAHSPNTCDQCGYSGVVHDEYLDGEDASYVCPDCDAFKSDSPATSS